MFLETPLPLDELVAQTQLAPRLGDTRVTPSSILTAGPLFFILRAVPVPSPATSIPGWATEDRPKVLLVEVRVAADSSAAAGANQVRDHVGEDTGQALCTHQRFGADCKVQCFHCQRARAYAQCLVYLFRICFCYSCCMTIHCHLRLPGFAAIRHFGMNVWPLAVVRLYGNQAYGQGAVFGPYIVLLQFVSMQMNSFLLRRRLGLL